MAADQSVALALKIQALVQGTQDIEALSRELQELIQTRQGGVPDLTREMREGAERTRVSILSLRNAVGALAASAVVKEFIDANAAMESLGKSLELVTGSAEAANAELAFVRAEADRLGLEVGSVADSYLQLAAAAKGTALEGQATREVWSAVAGAMAKLGKSSADTQGALLAIGQMMSKGVVSAEELRGQLNERLPVALQAAAKAMGVTTQELGKLLQEGKIVSADFLPKFARELDKTFGGGEVNTFAANLNRLKTGLVGLAVAIGSTGLFDAISFSIRKLGEAITYTVASAKALAAIFKGREAFLAQAKELRMVTDRLLGIGAAAGQAGAAGKQAGADIAAGMAQATPATARAKEAVKELAEAYKTLGVDPEEFRTGMDAASREVLTAFRRIAADPVVGGDALLAGFLTALDKASGEAIPALAFELKSLARERPFERTRVDADQLAAGLEAVKAKTAGLWPELAKADKSAANLVRTYQNLIAEANRLRAGVKAPVDESIEGQASATFDLANAQEKLIRLQGTGGGLEAIRQQADLVRGLSTRLTDQNRAQEGVAAAALIEAAALEREAGAIKQVAEAAGKGAEFKVKADTSEARAQMQAFIDEFNRSGGLQLKVNLIGADGAALPAAISQAALARGARR